MAAIRATRCDDNRPLPRCNTRSRTNSTERFSPGECASSSVQTFARKDRRAAEPVAADQSNLGTKCAGQHLQHLQTPDALRIHHAGAGVIGAVVMPVHGYAGLEFEHQIHEAAFPAETIRFGEDICLFAFAGPAQQFHRLDLEYLRLHRRRAPISTSVHALAGLSELSRDFRGRRLRPRVKSQASAS